MHAPPEVTALGVRYFGTYLLGAPLIFGFFAVDAAFRAAGDTRTPFSSCCASVAVTLVLDPMLIVGWGPVPSLGVAGAAIATICTRAVAFVIGLDDRRVGAAWCGSDGPTARALATVLRIGLPTAVTGVVFSLIYVFVTRTATQFGTPALAALGIGHRVESWLYMIGVGFGAATAAIVGQNLGAGRADRAERAGWISVAFCSVFGVVALRVGAASSPSDSPAIFSSDPAVIAEAARYLRIAALSQLGICAEIVLEGALGGAGATLPPMLTSTVITASRIPLAAWAAARWGIEGLWWTISLTALLRAVGMMAIWRAGRWKRTLIASAAGGASHRCSAGPHAARTMPRHHPAHRFRHRGRLRGRDEGRARVARAAQPRRRHRARRRAARRRRRAARARALLAPLSRRARCISSSSIRESGVRAARWPRRARGDSSSGRTTACCRRRCCTAMRGACRSRSRAVRRRPSTAATCSRRRPRSSRRVRRSNRSATSRSDPVIRRTPEATRRDDGAVQGEVITVDRFGNAVTNLLAMRGGQVQVAGLTLALRRTYADAATGEAIALVGSSGLVEVAVRDGSAAEILGLSGGAGVVLLPRS